MKILTAMILVIASSVLHAQTGPSWTLGPTLSQPRAFHSVVLVNDSTALVIGGWRTATFGKPTNACDFVVATSAGIQVRTAASMTESRAEFPAFRMGDTAIIVFGGVTLNNEVLKEVELYNIRTDRWTTIGLLKEGRRQHVAFPIGDTKFMVVGGRREDLSTMSSAEIFDVSTGRSQSVKNFPEPINGSIGTITSKGVGVVFGGRSGGANSTPRSEKVRTYNNATNTWDDVGTLSAGREAPMSTRLRDGRIVIVGGAFNEQDPLDISSEVVLESASGYNTITKQVVGRLYCAVTEYDDGKIVIAGGQDVTTDPVVSTQFVDAESGVVTAGPDLNVGRYRTRGASLSFSGSKNEFRRTVLVIGGVDIKGNALNSIEFLDRTCTSSLGSDLLSSPTTLNTVGSAKIDQLSKTVLLTGATALSAGAVWYKDKLAVSTGLSTSFSFRLSQGNDNGQADGGSPGADGVALVIQNSSRTPLGESGQGMGYEDIPNALAIEFDSYLNASYSDPSGSHVAVQAAKNSILKPWHRAPYLVGSAANVPTLEARGNVYYVKVDFLADMINVYLDTTQSFSAPVLSIPGHSIADLISLDASGAAWVGITSATGFSVQRHELLSWSIEGCDALVTEVDDAHAGELLPQPAAIYPMPSSDRAQLRWPAASRPSRIEVYNMTGQSVWSRMADLVELTTGIDLPSSDLSSGSYIVQISSANSTQTLHWHIQR